MKLTKKQIKAIAKSFKANDVVTRTENWPIGKPFFIRTVTMIVTGRLLAVTDKEFVLDNAAWIAKTGRYMQSIATGDFDEVEPYPAKKTVFVGRGGLIDAIEIPKLSTEQK